jgi:hypothetical protein
VVLIALRSPKAMKMAAGATGPGCPEPQGAVFESVPK